MHYSGAGSDKTLDLIDEKESLSKRKLHRRQTGTKKKRIAWKSAGKTLNAYRVERKRKREVYRQQAVQNNCNRPKTKTTYGDLVGCYAIEKNREIMMTSSPSWWFRLL